MVSSIIKTTNQNKAVREENARRARAEQTYRTSAPSTSAWTSDPPERLTKAEWAAEAD